VFFGAFGAHALKNRIAPDLLAVYKTGVEYHFYHALGVLLIGILSFHIQSANLNWAAVFLTVGIFLFSGSLYALAITGIKWFGAITPVGGVGFILGWIMLILAVVKKV
jgi:uncharacterized membrane protein YgdD (TMEM256/DUF423 family)